MTSHPQPEPEYLLITSDELSYLANTGSCYDEEIEEKVRSRFRIPAFTNQEWQHLVSITQLDSLKGDKQSENLYKKMILMKEKS